MACLNRYAGRILQTITVFAFFTQSTVQADSYFPFKDLQVVDRSGWITVHVCKKEKSARAGPCSLKVWTRLPIRALEAESSFGECLPSGDLGTRANGPIRTLYSKELSYCPRLVRVCPTAVAVLDEHGLNTGLLGYAPALIIFVFGEKEPIQFTLNELFANGQAKYYHRGGRINWLQNAWFDRTGKRLFLVSHWDSSNGNGCEIVSLSLESRKIEPLSRKELHKQVMEADVTNLAAAFGAANLWSLKGLDKRARELFEDASTPLPIRLRAAAYLYENGDRSVESLLVEITAFKDVPLEEISHRLICRVMIHEDDYWQDTVGYASSFCLHHELPKKLSPTPLKQ